jgi:hypothetical protein
METKTAYQLRIEEENKILKNINKEILKCAKKEELHYYWDITGISSFMVKVIIERLESEGKFISSKGSNFKIIRW